jgi:hypothetical protein
LSLSEEEKGKQRERARRYYERHKDRKREYYLKNRNKRIKYQEKQNLYHEIGTTNFGSNTDLDYELKRLGLYKYKKLWHASTKKELEKARKKLEKKQA